MLVRGRFYGAGTPQAMLVLASPLGRASVLLRAHAAIDGFGGCRGVAPVRDRAWRRILVARRRATREPRRCAVDVM